MKKIIYGCLFLIIIGLYIFSVNDPLNAAISFLLAGIIPGTDIMLGLWPTFGLGFLLLLILRRSIIHVRLQMLEKTAKEIKHEAASKEFSEKSAHAFDPSLRSVVAAQTSKSTV